MPPNPGLAVRHLQAITKNDEWETPKDVFEFAVKWAGFRPALDVAATHGNAMLPKYLAYDALKNDWVFDWWCNPPYSRVAEFIEHGLLQSRLHKTRGIFLTFAKTDTRWFHLHVVDNPNVQVKFIKGRIKFWRDGKPQGPSPYPSMLLRVEC